METVNLDVEVRTERGKGNSRKLRQQGKIPGVIYGNDINSIPIIIDAKSFEVLASHGGTHQIISLNLKDNESKKKQTAIIKEIQRHPYKRYNLHVDFQKIALDQEIESTIPIQIIGEAPGQKAGGVLQHGTWEINVKGIARNLPDHVEIDISGVEIGDSLKASDIKLPEGLELLSHSDEMIVSVVPPAKAAEEVLPAEEITEPEVIEKAKLKEEASGS
jgi:large subunit ribosomal protein L25